MTPTHFARLYVNSTGPEYPADERVVDTVLRSMAEHADGPDSFKVRLRFGDGSTVIVTPKRKRGA